MFHLDPGHFAIDPELDSILIVICNLLRCPLLLIRRTFYPIKSTTTSDSSTSLRNLNVSGQSQVSTFKSNVIVISNARSDISSLPIDTCDITDSFVATSSPSKEETVTFRPLLSPSSINCMDSISEAGCIPDQLKVIELVELSSQIEQLKDEKDSLYSLNSEIAIVNSRLRKKENMLNIFKKEFGVTDSALAKFKMLPQPTNCSSSSQSTCILSRARKHSPFTQCTPKKRPRRVIFPHFNSPFKTSSAKGPRKNYKSSAATSFTGPCNFTFPLTNPYKSMVDCSTQASCDSTQFQIKNKSSPSLFSLYILFPLIVSLLYISLPSIGLFVSQNLQVVHSGIY